MKSQTEKIKSFGASVLIGAKYDSHIVENLDADYTNDDTDDVAGFASLSTWWQQKFNNRFGLRADYNLYTDLHDEFKENDVFDQLVSVEPQWYQGNFIFSLPLRCIYSREDNDPSYYRYTIVPTVTLTFPDIHQAVEFYLTASLVADVDDYENFDEDAHARGGGMSYRRSDNLTSLGLEQNLQLTQRLDFMARYTFVHTHSNVAVYDYDQHIVQAGLSVSF